MAARLDKLSETQRESLAPHAQDWIRRALDLAPADRARVEAGIRACYRHAGLPEPRVIVWVPSPLVGALAAPIAGPLLADRRVNGAVRGAVRGAVDGAVRGAVVGAVVGAVRGAVVGAVDGAVGGAVGDAVGGAVGGAVRGAVVGAVVGAVDGAVGGAVGDAVDGAVVGAVVGAVDGAVGGAVGDAVDGAVVGAVRGAVVGAVDGAVDGAVGGAVVGAVRGAVDGAVDGAVGGAVVGAVRNGWYQYLGGQLWSQWPAYTSWFREQGGLDLTPELWARDKAYADAQSAGWWWPHSHFCMVCERMSRVSTERVRPDGWGSHRLHSVDGPAVAWAGAAGWALYYIHGVRVPPHVVEHPEQITVAEIDACTNAEVRRVMIERYKLGVASDPLRRSTGAARYLRDAGAVEIDRAVDEIGQPLRLLRREVPGDEPIMVVELTNSTPNRDGSRGTYYTRVPPTTLTAYEGRNWVCHLPPGARFDAQT